MKNKWLRGDNSVGSAVHFLILSSIYKPSFISIPFVLFKIWPGQATHIHTKFYLVLKLFAEQGTSLMDKAATICFPFWGA